MPKNMKCGMKMNGLKKGMKQGMYKGKQMESQEVEKEDVCPYCRKKNCDC